MESLYLLIPISVLLVFAIGVAFWFSLRSGQFEDMEGPAYRVIMDDDRAVQREDISAGAKKKTDEHQKI